MIAGIIPRSFLLCTVAMSDIYLHLKPQNYCCHQAYYSRLCGDETEWRFCGSFFVLLRSDCLRSLSS